MRRSKSLSATPVIFSLALTLSGCLATAPVNQGQPYGAQGYYNTSPQGYYNAYPAQITQISLDDLYRMNRNVAEQQLYARGFRPSGHELWHNSTTNQCFKIDFDDGRVKKIDSKNPNKCNK